MALAVEYLDASRQVDDEQFVGVTDGDGAGFMKSSSGVTMSTHDQFGGTFPRLSRPAPPASEGYQDYQSDQQTTVGARQKRGMLASRLRRFHERTWLPRELFQRQLTKVKSWE